MLFSRRRWLLVSRLAVERLKSAQVVQHISNVRAVAEFLSCKPPIDSDHEAWVKSIDNEVLNRVSMWNKIKAKTKKYYYRMKDQGVFMSNR